MDDAVLESYGPWTLLLWWGRLAGMTLYNPDHTVGAVHFHRHAGLEALGGVSGGHHRRDTQFASNDGPVGQGSPDIGHHGGGEPVPRHLLFGRSADLVTQRGLSPLLAQDVLTHRKILYAE